MCLVVYTDDKKKLNWDVLESGHWGNSDGWGIMYPDGEKVRVARGFYPKLDESWEKFKKTMDFIPEGVQVGIHFRIRTHGVKELVNCHPFKILDKKLHGHDLYLMHNGTISGMDLDHKDDPRSDTAIFAEEFMRPMLKGNPKFMDTLRWQKVVRDIVGHGSRLLFMRGDGSHWIYNKTNGTERDGVWYSNSYSLHGGKKNGNGGRTMYGHTGEWASYNNREWVDGKWVPRDSKQHVTDSLDVMLKSMGFKKRESGLYVLEREQAKSAKVIDLSQVVKVEKEDDSPMSSNKEIFYSAFVQSLKTLNEKQMYYHVIEHTNLAVEYMSNNGFSGGRKQIAAFVNDYPEDAAEWIFYRVNNMIDRINQMDLVEQLRSIQGAA